MAVIKCKMCGGSLNIIEGKSVCECEYCGTWQTIPMLDDEKKINLFTRANRLRFKSEFDKASGIYESIVENFPEEAEAYWGLVLCKYGIEYVDDPAMGKKIPTCHRSSFDSVMQDSDFDLACEYADPMARKVYREEAKQIEEIRKGILKVSGREEPYDIFICYKETDPEGRRTLDSVLAQDLYDTLTDKGYRVFFARITLEDKLGQEYEPYIFAALNSAKIMLAVGTDYDYYNAVWVKNEWSRYLKLMMKDKGKHLIPCYKNLDAYDMPEEFAKLQAQDLGRVGAMQDLLRGVEKLLGGAGAQQTKPQQTVVLKTEVPGVESLLKRADMFLEDKEWEHAKEYYNRILDIDPECAEAYLGLNLAEHQCVSIEFAAEHIKQDCFASPNMEKAERFADRLLKERISAASGLLKERIAEKEAARKRAGEERMKSLPLLRQRSRIVIDHFISAGGCQIAALQSNGRTLAEGYNNDGQCNVSDWTDIAAISAGGWHTIGLRSNGTVEAVGRNEDGCCDLSDWTDIAAISGGENHTVGLQSDGRVLARGRNDAGQCNVSDWSDIVAVSAGSDHTVGLRSDGTVVSTKNIKKGYTDYCDVSGWRNIVAISAGMSHTVGLRSDGTVVAVGENKNGSCNVSDWTDIVAVSAGALHTVGLRSDGTPVSTKYTGYPENYSGQCEISDWTDIVAVSAGPDCTAGLRRDGTVVVTEYAGRFSRQKYLVSDWKLFTNLKTLEQERKDAEQARKKEEECKAEQRRSQGLCPYCGGTFRGFFTKVCTRCGKPKDY